MQFLLAHHIFVHFSCIRTLSFLYIYSQLWLCFLSLPLSLSLSLSHRLCMAPKCKSTPVWNPFHSRSSSSDLPTPPLHARFYDEKVHQDFSENFSKHGVHSEPHVILSNFADPPFPDVIHTQGWESLCEIPLRCPTVFILEFYSNMHDIDTFMPQFVTTFRGIHVIVTLNLIF